MITAGDQLNGSRRNTPPLRLPPLPAQPPPPMPGNYVWNNPGTVTAVTTTTNITPVDPNAPADIDDGVLNNINRFQDAFIKVGKMEWVLDPGEKERQEAMGTPESQIGRPGYGRGHWVYHGSGTLARQQALFVAAKSDPIFRKKLTPEEASIARAQGLTPTEWRIGERLANMVKSSGDPGDAPIGNDGLPIGYGSTTGYGNGGTPTATPGGQPLGPDGAVSTPTPGPEGHGGTVVSNPPPTPKPLPPLPLPPLKPLTPTSNLNAGLVAVGAVVILYLFSKM